MILLNVVSSLIAPIKPHANFKFKGFFSFDPIKFSFGSKSIMANETVMQPSMEFTNTLQNSDTSLCTKVFLSPTMFVVQKKNTCIPLIFHPTCPKPKNLKKVEWELSWAFHDVWAINCLGLKW